MRGMRHRTGRLTTTKSKSVKGAEPAASPAVVRRRRSNPPREIGRPSGIPDRGRSNPTRPAAAGRGHSVCRSARIRRAGVPHTPGQGAPNPNVRAAPHWPVCAGLRDPTDVRDPKMHLHEHRSHAVPPLPVVGQPAQAQLRGRGCRTGHPHPGGRQPHNPHIRDSADTVHYRFPPLAGQPSGRCLVCRWRRWPTSARMFTPVPSCPGP